MGSSEPVRTTPRTRRVADQIQRELAEILREELKDPRVHMVTLTGVEVSTDLAHARIYFSTLGDAAALEETAAGLRRAAGFLRSALGRRMRIHSIPELTFVHDATVEQGVRLSRLIDEAVAGRDDGE
ncbi:MAG: 30S ribosome-binding factor RbfA [Burkholderiales bacterium]|nr:30S ribosome-binding factor RbfA [Burkholderiales bacterium]